MPEPTSQLDRDVSREMSLELAKRFEYLNSEHMPSYMTITFSLANFLCYILARMNTDYMKDTSDESGHELSKPELTHLHMASLQWFCEVISICYQNGWQKYKEGDGFEDWEDM